MSGWIRSTMGNHYQLYLITKSVKLEANVILLYSRIQAISQLSLPIIPESWPLRGILAEP